MYVAAFPGSKRVRIAATPSSTFEAIVALRRIGLSRVASSAAQPTKSWSNFAKGR